MSDATDSRIPTLVIAGSVRIDPESRNEAIAAAGEMMRATREEPGCLTYTFSADLDDPGSFWIFEEWESQEALDAHFASPHMADFQRRIGGLGVKEMRIRRYGIASVGPLG